MGWWDAVIIIVVLIISIGVWLQWNYGRWKNSGIPYVEPSLIFGNFREGFTGGSTIGRLIERFYNMFPGEPAVGLYLMRSPMLLVRDLDLVKAVLVTNFNNFRENGFDIPEKVDPVLARNPFFLKGDEWKEARRKHTINHTANKLKTLFGFVEEVKSELIECVKHNPGKKYNAMDFCSRYTIDVLSSCLFGLKTRSHAGEDSDFRFYALRLFDTDSWMNKMRHVFPKLFNFLRIRVLPADSIEFYSSIVKRVVETRRRENLSRNDFIQNLMAEKGENFSNLDMTAQAITFFLDGYFTSSTEMSFMLYMIAINPDVQEQIRGEVNRAKNLDFETIHSLPYLDAVFHEALRLYPAVIALTRVCNEDITLTVKGKDVGFKTGDMVQIPVFAIQRDPEHFRDPLKFDPERFLEHPNNPAMLTFGAGPRACFGQRFARTQIKAGIAHLVKNFRILPGGDDYSMPTVENCSSILLSPDKEMMIQFCPL